MGNYSRPLNALFEGLGCETVVPPPITRRTIELGSRYSPEFVCLPFKINLGNFIEAIESGANCLVQAGRSGPCRYGLYGEAQEQILRDLGYNFKMLDLFSGGRQFNLLHNVGSLNTGFLLPRLIKYGALTVRKIQLIDKLEEMGRNIRGSEAKKGSVSKILETGMKKLDDARDWSSINNAGRGILDRLKSVETRKRKDLIKIGIVGELFVVMEQMANYEIETKLGNMGVQVHRPLNLSSLLKYSVFPSQSHKVSRTGRRFMRYELGAHASHSVGHAVQFAEEGMDGIIQLYPFTCMPEVSARSILTRVSKAYNIPMLHFSLGEQSAEAGFDTRLEAFVDMIRRGKKRNETLPRN